MLYRIEIKDKPGIFDAVGSAIEKDIRDLGITSVRSVHFTQVYNIEGDISAEDIKTISEEFLVDKISQAYNLQLTTYNLKDFHVIEVAYNPGVMDPAQDSVLKGIKDLGIEGATSVKTAKKYLIKGRLTQGQLKTISEKLLYNKLIQHIVQNTEDRIQKTEQIGYNFELVTVNLLGDSDRELQKISKDGQLFLNLREMRQIQNYFKKLRRNPTDCELETLAQTWSEHCGHKTFRGKIKYQEKIQNSKFKTKIIDNLLKSTIMKVTKELNKPWCVSVFQDNSGVIRFDDEYNVCFKVETHNHPSALEPFGGANTGIGGVIRDILGTGLGAKPICSTDVFCFAPPDM